jgi:hypothetical protein
MDFSTIIVSHSSLITVVGFCTILIYYCRKCCKHFLVCHSVNEFKYDDDQYDSNISYSHHKIIN